MQCRGLAATLNRRALHAYAGIGEPPRFSAIWRRWGTVIAASIPFQTITGFTAADFARQRGGVVLLTEKDAVKCAGLIAGEA